MEKDRNPQERSSVLRHLNYRAAAIATVLFLAATLLGAVGFTAFNINKNGTIVVESKGTTAENIARDWAAHPSIPGIILYAAENGLPTATIATGTTTKSSGVPLTLNTPFHTASVGKLFTATTILKLKENGVINLDDPISRYLPKRYFKGRVVIDGKDLSDKITIRHLLSHRSGLGRTDDDLLVSLAIGLQPQKKWTPDDLVAAGRRVPSIGAPGEKQHYSSGNYHLLGLVIEAATNRPYHEVVRELIFQPLGMNNTFEASKEWKRGDYLHHYVGPLDLSAYHPSSEFADGGFVTTATDLVVFGLALANKSIFDKPDTYNAMIKPPKGSNPENFIGLGIWVRKIDEEKIMLSHAGYFGIFLAIFPEEKRVVAFSLAQSHANLDAFFKQIEPLLWQKSQITTDKRL